MIGDWDNLRVFLTLAEEGNLTAAARRLRVSHPTVARRIRALEEELGSRLFDRLPDRFQPTEQALELLQAKAELRWVVVHPVFLSFYFLFFLNRLPTRRRCFSRVLQQA